MNQRQKKLLIHLLRSSTPISAVELSKMLKVSKKTIYLDIKTLQADFQNEAIEIISKSGVGIYLGGEEAQINRLYRDLVQHQELDRNSLEYRRLFLIRAIFLRKQSVSLDGLSNALYISKTSLYGDLDFLNQTLSHYGSRLVVEKSAILVEGQESAVQKGINQLILQYFTGDFTHKWPSVYAFLFSPSIQKLDWDRDPALSSLSCHLPIYYRLSLILSIAVFLERSRLGFRIEKIKAEGLSKHTRSGYEERADAFLKVIRSSTALSLSAEEEAYLIELLNAHTVFQGEAVEPDRAKLVEQVLAYMSNIEGTDFSQNHQLVNSLAHHFPAMILRLKMNLRIHNPLLEDIKRQYYVLFSELYYALSILEAAYEMTLNDEEVALVVIYFRIAMEKMSRKHQILVIFNHLQNPKLIRSQVENLLSLDSGITLCPEESIESVNFHAYDLIISGSGKRLGEGAAKKTVSIGNVIDEKDSIRIMIAYAENTIFEKRKLEPHIDAYLEEKLIFLDPPVQTPWEALYFLTDQLIEKGLVKEEYQKSVIDRERLSSTYICNGVSMPHGNPYTVNRSTISFLRFTTPCDWFGKPVRLVILPSFNNEDVNDLKEIIRFLYQLISEEEEVEELSKIHQVGAWMEKIIQHAKERRPN